MRDDTASDSGWYSQCNVPGREERVASSGRGPFDHAPSAVRTRHLEYVLRSKREEEDHADVVHKKMQGVRNPLVAVEGRISPDERDDGSGRQGKRQIDGPAERLLQG